MRSDQVCRFSREFSRRLIILAVEGFGSVNPLGSGLNRSRRYFVLLGLSVVAFVL